jgi:predicted dienelactone hydrolase
MMRFVLLLGFAIPTLASGQEKAAYPKKDPGPQEVASRLAEWKDAKRDRAVPVKIYHPKKLDGPTPIVIYSHGLGGSREGYAYLANFWASHGYVVVLPQHVGSDESVWKGEANPKQALAKAAANLRNATERPKDISFVIDKLEEANREDADLQGKLDLKNIGVGGHSFGSYTTLAIGGQVPGNPLVQSKAKDPRVKALIPMSSPAAKGNPDRAYGDIRLPCLHMTGTLDDSPIGETKPADRRLAFDHITGVEQWLITFDGGDHMIFSGRLSKDAKRLESDAKFQRAIKQTSLAFWDAYLKNDAAAKSWLDGPQIESFLGNDAKLERKRK